MKCAWRILLIFTHKRLETPGFALLWRRNGHDGVSNHQPHDCLLNRLFRLRSKKTSKLRVTGLCVGNSPGTAQMASNAENVSIWWRHHVVISTMATVVVTTEAPGHQYLQCWLSVYWNGPVSYKDVTYSPNKIRNWNYIFKKITHF